MDREVSLNFLNCKPDVGNHGAAPSMLPTTAPAVNWESKLPPKQPLNPREPRPRGRSWGESLLGVGTKTPAGPYCGQYWAEGLWHGGQGNPKFSLLGLWQLLECYGPIFVLSKAWARSTM